MISKSRSPPSQYNTTHFQTTIQRHPTDQQQKPDFFFVGFTPKMVYYVVISFHQKLPGPFFCRRHMLLAGSSYMHSLQGREWESTQQPWIRSFFFSPSFFLVFRFVSCAFLYSGADILVRCWFFFSRENATMQWGERTCKSHPSNKASDRFSTMRLLTQLLILAFAIAFSNAQATSRYASLPLPSARLVPRFWIDPAFPLAKRDGNCGSERHSCKSGLHPPKR